MKIEDIMRMIDDMVDVEFEDSAMLKNLKSFINQLEADNLELSKAIVKIDKGDAECELCISNYWDNERHEQGCIVRKAEQYLGERSERD